MGIPGLRLCLLPKVTRFWGSPLGLSSTRSLAVRPRFQAAFLFRSSKQLPRLRNGPRKSRFEHLEARRSRSKPLESPLRDRNSSEVEALPPRPRAHSAAFFYLAVRFRVDLQAFGMKTDVLPSVVFCCLVANGYVSFRGAPPRKCGLPLCPPQANPKRLHPPISQCN